MFKQVEYSEILLKKIHFESLIDVQTAKVRLRLFPAQLSGEVSDNYSSRSRDDIGQVTFMRGAVKYLKTLDAAGKERRSKLQDDARRLTSGFDRIRKQGRCNETRFASIAQFSNCLTVTAMGRNFLSAHANAFLSQEKVIELNLKTLKMSTLLLHNFLCFIHSHYIKYLGNNGRVFKKT
ncbi:hypothetical protein WN51_11298 [Melipona quadrifasciata]|uniref:Uncharacterized protein n=1 Tax=Melipona quadrifasciata TaxID=166423 RepID=A0A0M9A462_9HYME|nr:hypothetical protein WN51_11298 [Melipona quadrifasciata]